MPELVVISRNEARNLQMVREQQADGRWKTRHIALDPTKPVRPKARTRKEHKPKDKEEAA